MISTAVILAARKERDSEIPYPLLPFDDSGQTLIDRTVSILKELSVDNIYIVVGYKAGLFKKYSDIATILVNPEYMFSSSMASLAIASEYIKEDFLLIESDVICEKTVYQKLITSSKKNCLTIVKESGSGDEAMVEIENDVVVKISKDLHQLNSIDGEMIGVSKISLDALNKMMLRWKNNHNLKLNYEYLFLDSTEKHEHGFIYPKSIIWCDVDNRIDYENLRNKLNPLLRKKENPFDILNIIGHLRTIFPEKKINYNDESLKVEYIGGMTNRNFKVTLSNNSYVLRIPGNGTKGMIERSNEGRNTLLSNKMGISPNISYINDKTGIKLTDFIEDAETLNGVTIQKLDNLKQIAQIFRTLHKSSVRLNNEFNVFHEIINYERLMEECYAEMYDGYKDIRNEVFLLEDVLNEIGVEITPCHNDLVPENFIKDPSGKIYLIDWEYSGMNDPMWDFAALFLESNFSEESKEYILQKYLSTENISDVIWKKIEVYSVLVDILWSIWTVIKEKQGDDFGSYGIDRFNRAISNLKKIQQWKKQ